MIIIYILGGIIAIFLMYILFLFVCSLFVRTDRQYRGYQDNVLQPVLSDIKDRAPDQT